MPKPSMNKSGTQGDSGYTPKGPTSKEGAYGYSARRMGGATTANVQQWNGYSSEPTRDGSIKGGRGMSKSGQGSDY